VVAVPIVIAGGANVRRGRVPCSQSRGQRGSLQRCRASPELGHDVPRGVFWPVRQLPGGLAWVAHLLPITCAADLLRGALAGLPLEYPVVVSVGVLLVWGYWLGPPGESALPLRVELTGCKK